MATITAQSTRSSGRAQNYAKKGYVAISAIGAPVATFEEHLHANRKAHGKGGVRPRLAVGEDGKPLLDENGAQVIARDKRGKIIHEAQYVQAYPLVQSFGHDELDPDDPESWTKAQEYGRAIVQDQFAGHMALIATEVNGRSGCVHNHIILDAINVETGKSLDTNRITHARLAVQHDRILAEHGFAQREDMAASVAAAKAEMARAEAEVRAAHEGKGISASQLRRTIIAAQNKVKVEHTDESTPAQKREQRRMREYDRYVLGEQTREAQLDIGVRPEPEKFSEIVLESRIKESLSDPRARTWEDLKQVGRDNGVVITRRGTDVSYGMVLADTDGELAEPSPAHRRRGKSLGEGFGVQDVEAALESNRELKPEQVETEQLGTELETEPPADKPKSFRQMAAEIEARTPEVDMSFLEEYEKTGTLPRPTQDREPEREVAQTAHVAGEPATASPQPALRQEGQDDREVEEAREEPVAAGDELEAGTAEDGQEVAAPVFRSKLRERHSKSSTVQKRLEGIAAFEERWHEQLPTSAEERARFEQEVKDAGGVGTQFMDRYGGLLDPQIREHLTTREQWRAAARRQFDDAKEATAAYNERLERNNGRGWSSERDAKLHELGDEAAASKRKLMNLRDQIDAGDYLRPTQELQREQQERMDAARKKAGIATGKFDEPSADVVNTEFRKAAERSSAGWSL